MVTDAMDIFKVLFVCFKSKPNKYQTHFSSRAAVKASSLDPASSGSETGLLFISEVNSEANIADDEIQQNMNIM